MDCVTQKYSLWPAIVVGVLGLVVGYSVVVFSSETIVANGGSCPSRNKGCVNGECQKREGCAKGECGKDCPGCQHNV